MRESPKSHLVTENSGPAKLQGRTAVHFDGPESDRQRRDRAQKASAVRYRRLFESAPYGILVLDADTGVVIDVNPAVCKLLEYEQHDVIDHPLWNIPAFKNAAATRSQFRDVLLQSHVRYDNLPLELRDGRIKHIEFVSTPFIADGKQFIQCVIHDITARVREEQETGAREEQQSLQATRLDRDVTVQHTHDAATGLVNRSFLEETLPRELYRAERAKTPLTVTVLAPDGGTPTDSVIREVGRVIREHLRKSDMAARYTGEEFVLVLPNSSPQATIDRVEQIRTAVRGLEVLHGDQRLRGPVVSAGVAQARAHLTTTRALLNAACEALSEARQSGGDRVVLYEEKTKQ